MKDYPDVELVYQLTESEEASDILFEKYKYIVDIVIKKYMKAAYNFNVDLNDLRQEAYFAFADALYRYKENRDASLATFITLVVERRVRRVVDSANTMKSKLNSSVLSLEHIYPEFENSLMYIIGDDSMEPLKLFEDKERTVELIERLKKELSGTELEVCELLLNQYEYKEIAEILNMGTKQVDNCIQRIRNKLKKIMIKWL